MDLEKQEDNQHITCHWTQQTSYLTKCIFECVGVFIYVTCAETIKIAYLLSGDRDVAGKLAIIYFCPLVFAFISATRIPWPRLMGLHLHPGVTLTLTIFRRFPVSNLLPFVFSQLLGATFGALCVHAGYRLYVGVIAGQHSTIKTIFVTVASLWPVSSMGGVVPVVSFHNSYLLSLVFGWICAMLLGLTLLEESPKNRKVFLGGPAHVVWVVLLYLLSVLVFLETGLVLNIAHGLGAQIASWILQDAPLCLQWPLPLASLISIPAIMAGASIYKLRTLGEPDGLWNYAEIP
ncbi:uncharacterized protein MELLADRAFT_73691 [Melampsora larici-populina 98AG31]|uniref:Uncharacterized protein n=1 Tax=Melampsora larici-populina (strain 98AG31 / pathotype 3-4-7) TaxID=747676 RepID=F4SC19_MELLP|nr:uncharacterized protein MELLADRAFT_73691 [Melampsora larici-populina 98AG31]EGF97813.1 hypothetical protein MELLADRAFT_73691 [Melampsora larici-populina 98AG31]